MRFSENVTLLGASKVESGVLTEALMFAPHLVAADGGAKNAVKIGQLPEFVIGDFDSVDAGTLAQIPDERQIRVLEQDTTDFEKCLSRIEAPLILGVGFLGRRLDHQMASLNALVRFRDRAVVLMGSIDLCFHLPQEMELQLKVGQRLSLFPMADVTGTSDGLRWPIAGIPFAPDGRIGTSNEVSEPGVRLRTDGPGLLAIMPRAALASVVRALSP